MTTPLLEECGVMICTVLMIFPINNKLFLCVLVQKINFGMREMVISTILFEVASHA